MSGVFPNPLKPPNPFKPRDVAAFALPGVVKKKEQKGIPVIGGSAAGKNMGITMKGVV